MLLFKTPKFIRLYHFLVNPDFEELSIAVVHASWATSKIPYIAWQGAAIQYEWRIPICSEGRELICR
jgi:hypothetical protein